MRICVLTNVKHVLGPYVVIVHVYVVNDTQEDELNNVAPMRQQNRATDSNLSCSF